MAKKTSNSSKQTSLFDIRLKNHDHDVVVLKGPPQDAASALLSGKIALSVKEPFAIRKLSLRLYATLRINIPESPSGTRSPPTRAVRHERKIYEYVWDNMEINKYLNNMYDNSAASGGLSRSSSSSSIKGLSAFRTKSSGNLSSMGLTPSDGPLSRTSSSTSLAKANHILVSGNYEFPFSAILPGSIPESVEGNPTYSVVYKLEAVIDRGKFHNMLVAKKHLRIIRTLTTDAVELSETMAVDNTWPKKVEYSLTIPSKAIAVGSGTPISMMLVPLLKGLRLGEIRITLVEIYSCMGYVPPVHTGERVVSSVTLPAPTPEEAEFQLDKWEAETFLRVPSSLTKCTQDCDIMTNVKVRHKIKFAIGLVNPDGHVSELRASLPVMLFISPFVSVRAVPDEETTENHDDLDEEVLFAAPDRTRSLTNLEAAGDGALRSNGSSYTSMSGIVAPPLYEQHIYDQLWSDISPIDSPLNSGASTPRSTSSYPHSHSDSAALNHLSMSPIDSAQLTENLRLLSLQRQVDGESAPSTPSGHEDRPMFNLDGDDYVGRRPLSFSPPSASAALVSPGMVSPVHLSRAPSENFAMPTPMSTVPSYSHAMKSSEAEEDLPSPAYEPPLPGSRVDISSANRNWEEQVYSTSAPKSRPSFSRGNSGRPHSDNSSPSGSRSASSTNVSGFFKTASPKIAVPAAAALSTSPGAHSGALSSVAQPSSSASDRTAAILGVPMRSSSSLSLHNLHFLTKKKDKKAAI